MNFKMTTYNQILFIKDMQSQQSNFKDSSRPSYRINYQQCSKHFEKLNYVCLDKNCRQCSLICSFCKNDSQHVNHLTKPLKFYLEEIQDKYKNGLSHSDYEKMLDQLQVQRYYFCSKLQQVIQQIADQFRKLEEQIFIQTEKIRSSILGQIQKKNKFQQFYQSLKNNHLNDSKFLIQNYLPQRYTGKLTNIDSLSKLSEKLNQQINSIQQLLISEQQMQKSSQIQKSSSKSIQILTLQNLLIKPNNITFDNGELFQTIIYGGKNLCLLDIPARSIKGKINLKVITAKKGAEIIIGAMTKQTFNSMNEIWNVGLVKDSIVLSTSKFQKGWQLSGINQYWQGSILDIHCKGEEFVITQKNAKNIAKLDKQKDYFIFIVLNKDCRIKLSHNI